MQGGTRFWLAYTLATHVWHLRVSRCCWSFFFFLRWFRSAQSISKWMKLLLGVNLHMLNRPILKLEFFWFLTDRYQIIHLSNIYELESRGISANCFVFVCNKRKREKKLTNRWITLCYFNRWCQLISRFYLCIRFNENSMLQLM